MSPSLNDICYTVKETISPAAKPDKEFVHYSIPAFDNGAKPETVKGHTILSSKLALTEPCLLFSRLNPRIKRVWDLTNVPLGTNSVGSTEWVPFVIKDLARVSSRYLYWFLSSDQFINEARSGVRAATKSRERVSKERLFEISIPLPPLDEQKRIAAVLDAADALRAKRRTALAKLDTLLQSVFLEMFGDPVTNPMGWEVVELDQVCTRITDGTHQSPKWEDSGIPFLFVSNVVDNELDFDTKKFISLETYQELHSRRPIEPGDILYTIVGSYGNAAIVQTERKFSFQRHIAHLKPDTNLVAPAYLHGALLSHGVRRQVDEQVRGVAQKTLNLRELKKIWIVLPGMTRQQDYVALRERVLKQKQRSADALSLLDDFFASLQQSMFRSGQTIVN